MEPVLGALTTVLVTVTVRVLVTYFVCGRRGALLVEVGRDGPLRLVRDAPPTMSCARAVVLKTSPAIVVISASIKVAMNLDADKNLMTRTSRIGAKRIGEYYSKRVWGARCAASI